ncbi:MAG: alpha/beta hydrolase [Burkholderiales bacterium]
MSACREQVSVGPASLPGRLLVPSRASAIVLLGQGGGAPSPLMQSVDEMLLDAGIATLVIDFLGLPGAEPRRVGLGVEALAACMVQALDWIGVRADLANARIGTMSTGIGAAAVLRAEGQHPGRFSAIVLQGGRVDLAGDDWLTRVRAPTLLIVGSGDAELERINRRALSQLSCIRRLEVVPRATHRLEQPGALASAAHLACAWLRHELAPRHRV